MNADLMAAWIVLLAVGIVLLVGAIANVILLNRTYDLYNNTVKFQSSGFPRLVNKISNKDLITNLSAFPPEQRFNVRKIYGELYVVIHVTEVDKDES